MGGYLVGTVLIGLGVWLIFDRNRFATDNAYRQRYLMPQLSEPRETRLSSFAFLLFGAVLVLAGAYALALSAGIRI